MKSEGSPQGQPAIPGVATLPPPQTPTNQATPLPSQTTPAYSGGQPPKATPTKSTLKALPTVRDHTTDQLNPSGDEYIPREVDEFGEKKVMPNGQLLGGRQYRCRTFLVPNRGDKLFMLATECARNLSYRDSYLLFNKNRSLFKIIASQAEKDDLVQQEILPFSYRSRQIAIVTARSMFRQFGSRVIDGGRRVRDDYWETKARKQGFTENDLAGEKRPGAAKAREAAEAQNNLLLGNPNPEIVYNTAPGPFPGPPHSHLIPELSDIRPRDYSGIIKTGPRQEITGPAYQDQSRPSAIPELNSQAQHAAEYNRSVTQQRDMRGDYLQGVWRRTHEQPPLHLNPTDSTIPTSRATGSPHAAVSGMPQPPIVSSQSPQMMMTAAPYSQSINAQGTPMRAGSTAGIPGQPGYNYQSGQMWSQSPSGPGSAYGSYTTQSQHASQSPAPQMRQGSGQMNPNMSQFPPMGGMQYGGQSMYPADQTPRQYMPQGSPTGQAWSGQHSPPPPQQQQQQQQQWWAQQQQPQ
ncbi:Putative Chromatin remodelling complex subunit [[Torrubiella] hemipterigena]|nr:Putative Chromatin remodelling complex subunit [[Torrubiella] hemipterigena]